MSQSSKYDINSIMQSVVHIETTEATPMSELSQQLRQLRIDSGMSQSTVGERVGLSRSAVTQIEAGNRDVSATELARFASVFRQSVTVRPVRRRLTDSSRSQSPLRRALQCHRDIFNSPTFHVGDFDIR